MAYFQDGSMYSLALHDNGLGYPDITAAGTAHSIRCSTFNCIMFYFQDGSMYSLTLHDNGLGYPDITAGDGVYSAYVPGYGVVPGTLTYISCVNINNLLRKLTI